MSLLLKKDKDPTECSSYRPLSLLNSDLKIFVKLLARRLESHMPKLVNSDQTGFIKMRMEADNVRRLLHIVDAAEDSKTPMSLQGFSYIEKILERAKAVSRAPITNPERQRQKKSAMKKIKNLY